MDVVRFNMPHGQTVLASKGALARRAAFFAPLADESGPVDYGDAELQHLLAALSPGAQQALPLLIDALGSDPRQQASCQLEKTLFTDELLLHTFAAAHLLGAAEIMDAARNWAAGNEGRRLAAAVAEVDVQVDAAVLRTAAGYGLDRSSPMRLLHAAAEADAKAAAKVLVAVGEAQGDDSAAMATVEPPLDILDANGRTALHVCAMRDSAGVASVLIEASASVDALCDPPEEEDVADGEDGKADDSMGDQDDGSKGPSKVGLRTALHLAAYHDSVEVLQLLLDAKANVACCVQGTKGALTPLHECASADAVRTARILAPLAAAAAAASEAELSKILAESMEVEEDSASTAAESNQAAADTGEDLAVKWSRFLDPLQAKVGHNGSTPLHFAAENDSAGVVSALLEAKADPALGDDQGDTPVHCAMLYAAPRALDALLSSGASPSVENGSGELPLHLCAEFGLGDEDSELPAALERRHFSRSLRAQEQLVECLRAKGLLSGSLAHRAAGDVGNTPLHAVVRRDHLGAQHAVQLLASARADLDATSEEGRTPLEISTRRYGKNGKVATLLRQLGAKEPGPGAKDDLAGALGGYVRPLVPPASQQPPGGAASDAMEVDAQNRTQQPPLPVMATQ